jgi:hypothetical protein
LPDKSAIGRRKRSVLPLSLQLRESLGDAEVIFVPVTVTPFLSFIILTPIEDIQDIVASTSSQSDNPSILLVPSDREAQIRSLCAIDFEGGAFMTP